MYFCVESDSYVYAVKQKIMSKRHRACDDSLMVTSVCNVRNCETSQVDLMNLLFLTCKICSVYCEPCMS